MRGAYILTAILALQSCPRFGDCKAQEDDPRELALQAVSEDHHAAEAAISALRARGHAGLDALFTVHAATITRAANDASNSAGENDSACQRIHHAMDSVGGQRDCHAAHLFWYTDFGRAKAAARSECKPILSLRLLGKLTDEYSCANSRFFRSTLYANKDVSRVLRERFVLHWQSVRPVPTVTIDFGDGRKLVHTVTGNSVHYVLTADGQSLDAIPGLYGPSAFLRCLEQADEFAQAIMASDTDATSRVADYHARQSAELQRAWQSDLEKLGLSGAGGREEMPRCEDADEKIWGRVAELHANDARLDVASRNLIASHHPRAATAARVASSKLVIEAPMVRLIRELQGTIALDTVRNEYLLHRRIHDWFAGRPITDVRSLNNRVYAELFLTPSSDPWLGLLPDAYIGLENDGVVLPGGS